MGRTAARRTPSPDSPAAAWRLPGVRLRVTGEVARREITVLTRTRTWRVTTVLLVLLTAVAVVLIAGVGGDDGERRAVRVGHTEQAGALQELLADPDRSQLDIIWVRVEAYEMPGDLRRAGVAVVVDPPRTLVWEESVDDELAVVLRQALTDVVRAERAGELGLSGADLAALLAPLEIRHRFTGEGPEPEDETSVDTLVIGLTLTILTFVGLQVYGSIVITSVVKEKADRVVEVLLAHVRTRELLLGKIAGVSAVAAAQVAAVVLTAAAALSITGALDLPTSVWVIAPLALVIFLLGFGFYAMLLAVAGSLVSRIEDGQLVALPVMLPLMVSYIVGLSLVIQQPDILVSRLLSYIPLSSPVVMPIRVVAGGTTGWEIALSVFLLLAATWWTIVLAGRVYESTLLRTGARTTWRDALRLARRDVSG